MGVSVTQDMIDDAYRRLTVQADTATLTVRFPAVDGTRRAWERLWANESLNARSDARRRAAVPRMADHLETK